MITAGLNFEFFKSEKGKLTKTTSPIDSFSMQDPPPNYPIHLKPFHLTMKYQEDLFSLAIFFFKFYKI